MSNVAYALTTTTKVKLHLGISGSTDDTLLDQTIAFVTDWIESACGGRRFKETTHTDEIYDSNGGRYLFLRHFPVSSITSIKYRGGTIGTPVWTALTTNDYMFNAATGTIDFLGNTPVNAQNWQITYVAGFKIDFTLEYTPASHNLPFDLCYLATALVAKVYNNRSNDGIQSMSTEGQSISLSSSMSPELLDILRKYQSYRLTA